MLREVVLQVDGARVEAFADALVAAGALAVSVDDADAHSAAERPLYGEPGIEPAHIGWPASRVVVLLDASTDCTRLLGAAAAGLFDAPPPVLAMRAVEDADWVRLTQTQFPPLRIGRLWVVPSWHQPPEPEAIVIRLDPGVAFGTGTHPTTRLCLQWLDQNPPAGRRVLDYGCGSGILAIAAAKLGAAYVAATDIDPQALAAARANAAANAVAGDYTAPELLPAAPFDVVLANILANPLKLLAPLLVARVAPGGTLVLAGVLERQADEVIDVYTRAQLALDIWRVEEGWACLAGRRS
ncbi:MAG TPA: 50S ribosomal protein L11 methyltransferase [Burkholderiaceae bacterium]|nr:50S ribosomal protein L11 methyltransferase [Burkholderiaceae bacterium]